MVYLNRIYTRSGDDGRTGLGDGARVDKTHPRIVAYGAVDELNAAIGLALSGEMPEAVRELLQRVQNDLFDVGADLCIPESASTEQPPLRVTAEQVTRLENRIDELNKPLQPLTSFILPGGSEASARLHAARTVCRRAEIEVRRLNAVEPLNEHVTSYLNRLSDLLFVMARVCNDEGRGDVLWKPGEHRD